MNKRILNFIAVDHANRELIVTSGKAGVEAAVSAAT
jgi:hypothetical protein